MSRKTRKLICQVTGKPLMAATDYYNKKHEKADGDEDVLHANYICQAAKKFLKNPLPFLLDCISLLYCAIFSSAIAWACSFCWCALATILSNLLLAALIPLKVSWSACSVASYKVCSNCPECLKPWIFTSLASSAFSFTFWTLSKTSSVEYS